MTDGAGALANGHSAAGALHGLRDAFELGFELDQLYQLALRFYKGRRFLCFDALPLTDSPPDYEMKAFSPSYEERNRLAALTLQSKHGPAPTEKEYQLGALDFVGRDRRQAWQSLGSMARDEAMRHFCRLLQDLCPLFLPFLEAHAKERDDRRLQEEQESQKLQEEFERMRKQEHLRRFESQK